MESATKSVCLWYTLLCLLVLPACTQANKVNCTEEHKSKKIDKCSTAHLMALEATDFFDRELAVESETFYKDPHRYVSNSQLCEDPQEAARYVECAIQVFADCVETNSTDAEAHTSPAMARKAVEKLCNGLNMISKKANNSIMDLEECVSENEANTYKCAYDKLMNEQEAADDVCSQYKIYSECMSELDKCGEEYDKELDLFSTWAEQMTPTQCLDTGAASSVVATVWVMFATLLLSFSARW